MLCPICQEPARKFGRNRNGSQRFRCDECCKTFTDESTRPPDRRRLDAEKMVLCLRMLLEGNSIRSTERLTEVHRDTIMNAMVEVGENCSRFLRRVVSNVHVDDVEADEIWGFVGCKERTRLIRGYSEEVGDVWTFTAIERTSKLILAWHVGKRTPEATDAFAWKLAIATNGRFQLSTDGFRPYLNSIPSVFGNHIDYAQLIKVYGNPAGTGTEVRYSPGEVVDVHQVVLLGQPDDELVCTSHAERHNRTLRMQIRRLTRLTDAHSKKWENHEAAIALFIAYYNFCRVHSTLTDATRGEDQPVRKTTPAMAAGLTDHVWSVKELLEQAGRTE
jgi:transposase-like protein/IS1 family transposase